MCPALGSARSVWIPPWPHLLLRVSEEAPSSCLPGAEAYDPGQQPVTLNAHNSPSGLVAGTLFHDWRN